MNVCLSELGLESVKQKFLMIKAKVDTMVRQNASLKDERFGAALLGNPGTGMVPTYTFCSLLTPQRQNDRSSLLRKVPGQRWSSSRRPLHRKFRISPRK